MKTEWKTADELYQWAKDEQLKAIEWCEKHYLNEVSKDNKQTICSKPNRMLKISEAYLENIKILDDETIKNISSMFDFYKNIDLINISRFSNVYESITFFKKSRLSRDGTRYNQELTRLKNNADELQRLSDETIKFRIPILPHETLKDYIDLELRYCLDDDILRKLLNILEGREKLPKETAALKNKKIEYKKNQIDIIKKISNTDNIMHSLNLEMQELNTNYYYYTPKK